MQKDTPVLWLDEETTGLNSYHNDIIELAYLIERGGEIVQANTFVIAPHNPDNISDRALQIIGKTKDELLSYPAPEEVLQLLKAEWATQINPRDRADKMYVGGYNVHFDIDFLNQFFKKCNDRYLGSWINWRRLDALSLIHRLAYIGELVLPDYKLSTVAKYWGIHIEAHQATSDIEATMKVYYKALCLLGSK
jgi:DNA polymerase III alpha subunit (gram-positive type)